MDSKDIKSILQDGLEEELPSSEIKLWPAVKERLIARNHSSSRPAANITRLRNRKLVVSAFAVIALLALAFITPEGRAFAQSILQFFVRTDGDTISVPTETTESVTWVDLTPGVPYPTMTPMPTLTPMAAFAKDCGDFRDAACSVEQIRNKVDFRVKELADIPAGMYFIGATGGPDSVFLKYGFENNSGGLIVTEARWAGQPTDGTSEVGESAIVEKVKIGNLDGEYFRGSFVMQAGEKVSTWDPNFGLETLRWVDGEIAYTLQYDFTVQMPLGKEGLVAIAESMTAEPVARLPMPATATPASETWYLGSMFISNIAEVEELAGFRLLLPPRLPEFLSLFGARYDAENRTAVVYYHLITEWTEPYDNGLFLSQQAILDPNDCAICDIVVGEETAVEQKGGPMIVGANSNLEEAQIGSVTGKYVEGVWEGTDCCGWVWEPDAGLNTLRWQIDNRAFELQYLGSELNKADLIAIAVSLR